MILLRRLPFRRPALSRGIFSVYDKYKLANDINAVANALTEEDISRMRRSSELILDDPICDISEADAQKFILPADSYSDSLWDRARWTFGGRSEGTNRLFRLTVERLENRRLQDVLGVGSGFNQQLFWMMLHAWVLHKRMVVFNDGAQEEDYFEALFRIIDHWMVAKEIPRHRLTVEIGNAQKHALGFCVAMDISIERPDILGGRIQETLWQAFFDGQVARDDWRLNNLTKYTIRQAAFALHIPEKNFLQGQFLWADFPIRARPTAKLNNKQLPQPKNRQSSLKIRKPREHQQTAVHARTQTSRTEWKRGG